MPEVGLERDSRLCELWEVAETYGIRASPMAVRANPGRKVWTLFTLLFCPVATTPEAVTGHESSGESTMFPMGNNAAISIKSIHLLSYPSWRARPEVHDGDQQLVCHIGSPMRWSANRGFTGSSEDLPRWSSAEVGPIRMHRPAQRSRSSQPHKPPELGTQPHVSARNSRSPSV